MLQRYLAFVFFVCIGCSGKPVQTEKAVVKIPTSICGECERTIRTAVMKVKGVTSADINTDTKLAIIEYMPASATVGDIEHSIVMAGYDANGNKRDAEAYEKLPGCCKK